jgi:hypothetical protein
LDRRAALYAKETRAAGRDRAFDEEEEEEEEEGTALHCTVLRSRA